PLGDKSPLSLRSDIMNELMDINSKQDLAGTDDSRQPHSTLAAVGPTGGRHRLLVILVIAVAIVAGVVTWQRWGSRTKVASHVPPASKTTTDVVVLDESQLRQVSIEAVGTRTITVDRNTTGKVGFNEDRLTPVFTPYAGRIVELLANKGESVGKNQP